MKSSPLQRPAYFDPASYLAAYPDVSLSGLDPWEHYQKFGALLGRAPERAPELATSDTSPQGLDRLYSAGIIPPSGEIRHGELISVIMPSYNNAEWIERAIHSVLSQVGVRLELIIVDDGSTDRSVEIASSIADRHANVRVISLLRNFGCYYARNIAVSEAKGEWIGLLDSDDIMPPDRLRRQMDSLASHPKAVGSLGRLRRWTSDFSEPLTELKHAENSLLWKRDVIQTIGLYDTVRYGGDSEFRLRLQRAFGSEAVIRIPDEIYYLRLVSGSLANASATAAYSLTEGKLKQTLSPSRSQYAENFNNWQQLRKVPEGKLPADMRLEFPLTVRPFELGTPDQNASPSLGQRRVGAIASFPPRRESLRSVVDDVLPQLDELFVYLNEYGEVPAFLKSDKITVFRSEDELGDLRDNGKFFSIPDEDAYVFTFDDDITYPADYVSRMVHHIEMFDRGCIVGVHGVIFPPSDFTTLRQRTVYPFTRQAEGRFVDLLGTGTTAWHTSTLKLSLADFETKGVCDLWFSRAAAEQKVPLYCVPRVQGWLKEKGKFEVSLWQEASSAPQHYFETFETYVRPAWREGEVRKLAEEHYKWMYPAAILAAAGHHTSSAKQRPFASVCGRGVTLVEAPIQGGEALDDVLNFHLIINGWNCLNFVSDCLQSISRQKPASYRLRATLIDDGSEDGTLDKLQSMVLLPHAEIVRIEANTGPAFARYVGIGRVSDPNTIVVLVDMDDELEPHALRTVAAAYRANPQLLMTIGNWHDQHGKMNPQPFYDPDVLDRQQVRRVEMFNATSLRTFKRELFDALSPADFLDQNGKWLETCTDVALMYPLMDQCWSDEIAFIEEPIYRYRRQHSSGTLARFGKPHKVERLRWLKGKPAKPRLHTRLPLAATTATGGLR